MKLENICNLTKSEPEEVIEQSISVVPVILIETTGHQFCTGLPKGLYTLRTQVVFLAETLENKETLAVSQLRVREYPRQR